MLLGLLLIAGATITALMLHEGRILFGGVDKHLQRIQGTMASALVSIIKSSEVASSHSGLLNSYYGAPDAKGELPKYSYELSLDRSFTALGEGSMKSVVQRKPAVTIQNYRTPPIGDVASLFSSKGLTAKPS